MKTTLVFAAFALLAAAGAAPAQQASNPPPAPAQSATQPPQPAVQKPILKLRLDEIDDRERRTIIGSQPLESDNKRGSASPLPGLGGNPSSRSFDRPDPATIVPKSSEY